MSEGLAECLARVEQKLNGESVRQNKGSVRVHRGSVVLAGGGERTALCECGAELQV